MRAWLPESISSFGAELDALLVLVFWLTTPWFVVMQAILLWAVLAPRRRRARYLRGDSVAQLAWVLVPTALVLVLDLLIDARSAVVWAHLKQHLPAEATEVRVTARQFSWQFRYPGPDGRFDTADDLVLDNELHVPAGEPVVFALESRDVIHSFFIPNARVKQDAVPGRTVRGWFDAGKPGRYEIACAELCGISHYTMRAFLVVHDGPAYRRWLAAHWPGAPRSDP